jgi:long-chain fatty acid transport protein
MADTETKSSMYPSGAMGYFRPLSKNITVGILAYVPSGVGAKWPGEDLAMLSGGSAYTWESKIAMITVSPVIAYKINKKFSVGASLNINYVMLDMERPAGGGSFPVFQYKESLSGIGLGATFGAMYKPTDFLSIGVTYKTPIKASIDGEAEAPGLTDFGYPGSSDAERAATWPQWFGAGIAIKPNNQLTITADVQYNNWKKMEDIPITYTDAVWKAAGLESASSLELRWDDSVDIRFGVEYKLTDCLAIRGGYYINPSPAPEETLNIMLPNVDYNVITAGVGYEKKKFAFDFAFEYLTGEDRYVDPMNYLVGAGMPGTHGMNIISVCCAFTYKLGK